MFYLTTHSTHFIYGYMASDIWLRTILIVRKETRCRHIGYSYRLTARVLLYASSHRQDNTYHGLCYTSRGALAGTRNSSMGTPHEGSIRRPIAPWANALPLSYVPLPEEPAKAGTCARDRRALQQLALNVHVKHSDMIRIRTSRPYSGGSGFPISLLNQPWSISDRSAKSMNHVIPTYTNKYLK